MNIKSVFTIPDKEIKFTPLHRTVIAGMSAAAPIAILRISGYPFKSLIPTAIGGLMGGLALPNLTNKLIRYKQQKNKEKIRETLHEMFFPESDIGRKIKDMHTNIANIPDLSKQASFTSTGKKIFGKTTSIAGKGIWGGAKAIGRGFLPVSKTAPIGEKIFGTAVKGTALGGVGYGTYKLVDYTKRKRPYDYTTLLRNNILAGRIKPEELNVSELESVKRLGFA